MNEKQVKRGAATSMFYPGQKLEVVWRDANTIVVEYFDGKKACRMVRLEVVEDNQEDTRA